MEEIEEKVEMEERVEIDIDPIEGNENKENF